MNVIKINNLTKSYGKSRGINHINLEVREGEIFGFIGPNGAGKSTTIKTLLNLIFPTSGSATIFGMDVCSESHKIKKSIGYVPSEVNYYSEVKVKDIIAYAESFYPGVDKENTKRICRELELDMEKRMDELSLGNKKKVAIAQALISCPKLLILDEAANGLDPLMQKKLFEILLREKEKGVTIFLSSHNLVEVEKFCDRVAVIKEGEIVEVLDISNLDKKLGLKVTIEGSCITDLKPLADKIIHSSDNEIKFMYKGNINELIKALQPLALDKLLIEEENLEDSFLSYYDEKAGE